MSRFRTSWTIFRYSLHIMGKHPRLLSFPLISLVIFALLGLFTVVPMMVGITATEVWRALWSEEARQAAFAAARAASTAEHVPFEQVLRLDFIAWNLFATFIMTAINLAFFSQIIESMNGGRSSVSKGFGQAFARLPAMTAWSMASGAVAVLFRIIEEFSTLLTIVMVPVGICWMAATYFVIPVILNEPGSRTPLQYLKISMTLLKRVWAEGAIAAVGMTLGAVALLFGMMLINLGLLSTFGGDAWPFAIMIAVGGFSSFILLYLAWQVFQCGLYVYATQGVAPGTFDPAAFEQGWTVRDPAQGNGAPARSVALQHARSSGSWYVRMRTPLLALAITGCAALLLAWWVAPAKPQIVTDIPATEVPDGLPRLLPPNKGEGRRDREDAVMRAVLKQFPQLEDMPDGFGPAVVDIALRPDGSVYRSGMNYVWAEDRSAIMTDPSDLLPQRADDISGIVFRPRGKSDDSRLKHDLWVRYVILQDEPDSSRDVEHVRAAMLASHADLLLPDDDKHVNRVTVYLSEDGKVQRHYVESRDSDQIYPYGDLVPQEFGKRWADLGLEPDQLGRMGVTWVSAPMSSNADRKGTYGRMVVRYAWPRRIDEPAGEVAMADRHPRIVPFMHADVAAVLEHYLPGALNDQGMSTTGVPWLVLSQRGEVVRSGYLRANPDQLVDAELLQAGRTDQQIDTVIEILVVKKWKDSFARRVVVAWLKPVT